MNNNNLNAGNNNNNNTKINPGMKLSSNNSQMLSIMSESNADDLLILN
jgi:hypothetical protein